MPSASRRWRDATLRNSLRQSGQLGPLRRAAAVANSDRARPHLAGVALHYRHGAEPGIGRAPGARFLVRYRHGAEAGSERTPTARLRNSAPRRGRPAAPHNDLADRMRIAIARSSPAPVWPTFRRAPPTD
jgi:hypothetical protein